MTTASESVVGFTENLFSSCTSSLSSSLSARSFSIAALRGQPYLQNKLPALPWCDEQEHVRDALLLDEKLRSLSEDAVRALSELWDCKAQFKDQVCNASTVSDHFGGVGRASVSRAAV